MGNTASKKFPKYDEDIIQQILKLNIASNRSEIINAMDNVVNPRDINEIVDYINKKIDDANVNDANGAILGSQDNKTLIGNASNIINPPDTVKSDDTKMAGSMYNADFEFGCGWVHEPHHPDDRLKVFGNDHGDDFKPNINVPIKSQNCDLSKLYKIPIYNQDTLHSCGPNVLAFMYEYMQYQQNDISKWIPSRLFIYYNARKNKDNDTGVGIKAAIKSMIDTGVCPEDKWPYDVTKYTERPSDECYKIAENNVIIQWAHVKQELDELKAALLEGYPIIFGFYKYPSFSLAKNNGGIVSVPTQTEIKAGVHGGHGVVIVGYDDKTKMFKIRNSWGTNNGDKGYYYFPYDFILDKDICFNFWVIEQVS